MAYLLDSNVFITAKSLHYGFDFCPAFWDWIVREHGAGVVGSIERVGDEIVGVGDDLSQWAVARGPAFFSPTGPSDFPALAKVANWARTQSYDPAAVGAFLQVA